MSDFLDEVFPFAIGFAMIIVFLVVTVLVFQWGDITFIDNVPSVVKVDGKVVFEGSSAGFDVDSSGANTTVTVRGGPLFLFPKAYYVSKNVEVIGKK